MSKPDAAIPHIVLGNIDAVLEVEQRAEREVPPVWRLAHALGGFVGSIMFAVIHLALFAGWLVVNSGWWPGLVFDPYPFTLLGTLVSCEAVMLSTFVLIRQSRGEDRSSQRSHLDLQVNLLAEKELTKVLQIVQRISERVGAEQPHDAELKELLANTAVQQMAEKLAARTAGGRMGDAA